MGKGTIISHIADGKYQLQINYFKDHYEIAIDKLTQEIIELNDTISGLEVGSSEYILAKLQKTAIEKKKSDLEKKFPDDETILAWCADLTEDLSGVVETIEVPGESENIQIAPGYPGSSWSESAGQLVPTISQGAAQAFYNIAMLPGWQKWKPTFRYGTITSIDTSESTCNIYLTDIRSSQQSLGINQSETLSNVPIEYMACDSKAFIPGDEVLIKFDNQDWSQPKVIGFKEEPQACESPLVYIEFNAYSTTNGTSYALDFIIIFDLETNAPSREVTYNTGELVEDWPVRKNDISIFLNEFNKLGSIAVEAPVNTMNINIVPFGFIDTQEISDTCTEYFPGSNPPVCRAKTIVYESTCNVIKPQYEEQGYEIVEYLGESTSYELCGGPTYCDVVQSIRGLNTELTWEFKLSSLTNDTSREFEGLLRTTSSGEGYWNGNTGSAYLGKNPFVYYARTEKIHTFEFDGHSFDMTYVSEHNFEPGVASDGYTFGDIVDIEFENRNPIEPEWISLLSSVYGDEDHPYTIFLLLKDCVRLKNVVPVEYASLNPAIAQTLHFVRRESDNEWIVTWDDDPEWIAENEIVEYSGEPPEVLAFVADYGKDTDPYYESPFDATYNQELSEALNGMILDMQGFMNKYTPQNNFILYDIEVKFLRYKQ